MNIQPIFVIGRNRSGTKWLSNLISNHSEVACVRDERFGGILETNVFTSMHGCFGDLSVAENLAAFYILFSETSFFKITGLEKEELFSIRPDNYTDFFDKFMSLYAQSLGKSCWLQKSAPKNFSVLKKAYQHAKFIIIERECVDNICSSIMLHSNDQNSAPRKRLLLHTADYVKDQKEIQDVLDDKGDSCILIDYNDLKNDRGRTLKKIYDYLNLKVDELATEVQYCANTSFYSSAREEVLTWRDEYLIRLYYIICQCIPRNVLVFLEKRIRVVNPLKLSFVKGTFQDFMEEIHWIPEGINNTRIPIMKTSDLPESNKKSCR